jgi:hypothetical protein
LQSIALKLTAASLLAVYQYPVQQISSGFQPTTPGDAQAFFIYRDYQDEVIFLQLNQASLLLLHQLAEQPGQTLAQLCQQLTPYLPTYTAVQLADFALPLFRELATAGALQAAF